MAPTAWVERDELKRVALIEMPYLIGGDHMPATVFSLLQQKEDGGECRAFHVVTLDAGRGPVHFFEMSTFRVGLKPKSLDKFERSLTHVLFECELRFLD